MDERRQRPNQRGQAQPARRHSAIKRHMQKRKAALALSAGVLGMSAAAIGSFTSEPARAAAQVDNPLTRLPARDLRASEELKRALIEEEGVRDVVYRDVAGYPTVGCGHLVTPADGLKVGDRISYDRILDFLDVDLEEAQAAVARIAGDLPLFQHEFDALVDLVYNVGEGALTSQKSPRLMAALAAGDYEAMARELQYRFAGGQMARGLAYRSDRRTRMFMDASYGDTRAVAGATTAPAVLSL